MPAKSFARICGVIITQAMCHVIEEVVPLLGDSLSLSNRQGAVELIIVSVLDAVEFTHS